ncbi:MAG: nucleotide pyrophosphohydrolase [Clostridiales bacterium]|nr:nucleotide pyrophosphohydrolase [Clostridiales bacterium]
MNRELLSRIDRFNKDRDWDQFHSSENLAKSIAIEAGELLEIFQWNSEGSPERVKEELADVMIYCLQLAMKYDFDIEEIISEKISKNEIKYPASKAKGSSKKYTEFDAT